MDRISLQIYMAHFTLTTLLQRDMILSTGVASLLFSSLHQDQFSKQVLIPRTQSAQVDLHIRSCDGLHNGMRVCLCPAARIASMLRYVQALHVGSEPRTLHAVVIFRSKLVAGSWVWSHPNFPLLSAYSEFTGS